LKAVLVARLTRSFAIVIALALLCAGVWIERRVLLRATAELWIVSDQITAADAVVVLGGGIDLRPFIAADLYAKGLVKKVLVSQVDEGPSVVIAGLPGHTEANRMILLKLGVPTSAIETFGIANKNTFEEAAALKGWVSGNAVSAFSIPTEGFSARRVRWIFQHMFAGTSVTIEVPSFNPPTEYTSAEWWKTDTGIISFQNEVLKYLFYRLKY
jgi:uncharacterized SAM-binding protein YcdF (DUF218 family)